MSFAVYILFSEKFNQFYIGHTSNLNTRLIEHNTQVSKSTKKANDWKIVYQEFFQDRASAMRRETEIKRKKSRIYIQKLINHSQQDDRFSR